MSESNLPYAVLAPYYEELSDNRDWAAWLGFVEDVLRHEMPQERRAAEADGPEHLKQDRAVRLLDAACGTGRIARGLVDRGFDVVGVDVSAGMLGEAEKKRKGVEKRFLLHRQDVRELALDTTFKVAICLCDSLNYLLAPPDLQQAFQQIAAHLEPGGLFLFDVNTTWKLAHIYGDFTYAEHRENFSLVWENTYEPATSMVEMHLVFFIKAADGRYVRYDETHRQRAFSDEEIQTALTAAGLDCLERGHLFGLDPPEPLRERVFYLARKA